jgi:tight adherence protein B
MTGIVAIAFTAVFLLVFLGLLAISSRSSSDLKTTMARLQEIATPIDKGRVPEVADILREDVLSDIPWLNDMLHSFNIFPAMRKVLSQADVQYKLSAIISVILLLWIVVVGVIYMRTTSIPVSLALGAVAASVPWILVIRKRNNRFSDFEEKLPEALDLMVSAIRAGHGFASAVSLASRESTEPISSEFRQFFDEQNFGLDLRIAVQNLAERMPIPDVKLLASAVLIQKESGGNLAEILEKVAYVIRERFRLKRQVRVHTAQGRMTGWILAFAPVIFGVLLYLLDPNRMATLWSRPIGIELMWTAAIMDLIGALIIRKIVRPRI